MRNFTFALAATVALLLTYASIAQTPTEHDPSSNKPNAAAGGDADPSTPIQNNRGSRTESSSKRPGLEGPEGMDNGAAPNDKNIK